MQLCYFDRHVYRYTSSLISNVCLCIYTCMFVHTYNYGHKHKCIYVYKDTHTSSHDTSIHKSGNDYTSHI